MEDVALKLAAVTPRAALPVPVYLDTQEMDLSAQVI